MALGKAKKRDNNHIKKRLIIYEAYSKIKEDDVYYDKEDRQITGVELKKELEKKYKWLK